MGDATLLGRFLPRLLVVLIDQLRRYWIHRRFRADRLFSIMTNRRTLKAAWHRVRGNAGGVRAREIADFALFAWLRLYRLSGALRNGSYRPGPVRTVSLAKPNGTIRRLTIPSVPDRVAQTAAAMTLGRFLESSFSATSFAYRPGRSVVQAVEQVRRHARQGYVWLVDGDVRAFFDEVPHALLLERLADRISDPRVGQLVGKWLATFSAGGRGLAQGSPLSPLLSNLFLDPFDRRVETWPWARWVRYSDDFVLLCHDRQTAVRASGMLADELATHGLKLNRFKTRVTCFHDGFIFLGHAFRGESLAAVPRRLPSSRRAAI